ncbi:hypothetical protein DPEC_G00314110 [Dallia pectoralis]|uniref:Uncharacterized protein n=1 Tax=Dallia pectoralis TaxID=75939 RepID=A0ACC2FBU8_DALPE|nr:hypothetical protein DPEC_G00314110 [Dallia pectoralis]
MQGRTGKDIAAIPDRVGAGLNGGPSSSTPKTQAVPQGRSLTISPTESPLSLGSPMSSANQVSFSERSCKETDSGLCRSLPEGKGAADSRQNEMQRLVEECRTALGLSPGQYAALDNADVLKRLLVERQELTAEVQRLRETTEAERGEWLQFQADLQVAVAVADRLRAEAEEELGALRAAQQDTEGRLAAAQQKKKETDVQLGTLRGELRECRHQLENIQGSECATDTPISQEGAHRGRERGTRREARGREHEEMQKKTQSEGTRNVVREEAQTVAKGVTNLRNVTNEEKSGAEGCGTRETRKMVTQERSRSLSRLPVSSDSLTVQNGTSQSNTARKAGSADKTQSQTIEKRGLELPDRWSSAHTEKREETLNQYNCSLADQLSNQNPKSRSQDGLSLMLRRHGGSKRNSLLRWCQSRTQGYKNIDITNFSSSWADGLAFCAIYHTYLPSHIPYSTLGPDRKRENLSLAFKTGENVGIPTSLAMEEILRPGGPDWQRVLGYVESVYRHFEM